MGSIGAGTAPIPTTYATPGAAAPAAGADPSLIGPAPVGGMFPHGSGLSAPSIDRLRLSGMTDEAIAAASDMVSSARMSQSGGYPAAPVGSPTNPAVPVGAQSPAVLSGLAPDQMDATYPQLTARHVQIIRGLGFPEENIAALVGADPSAGDVEANVQAWVSQPAIVDQFLRRPAGTTAALLSQLPQELLANPASPGFPEGPAAPPVDQMDATYPQLASSHVYVLRAIGTREESISTIASGDPSAADVENYIQFEIMRHPEAWDAKEGNPAGTARNALLQLGFQPSPSGGVQVPGQPGPTGPVGPTGPTSIPIPGVNTQLPGTNAPAGPFPPAAAQSETEGWMKGLVVGGIALGLGVLAYKGFKNHQAKQLLTKQAATLGLAPGAANAGAVGALGGAGTVNELGLAVNAMGTGGLGALGAGAGSVSRPGIPFSRTIVEHQLIPDAALAFGLSGKDMLNYNVNMAAAKTLQGATNALTGALRPLA